MLYRSRVLILSTTSSMKANVCGCGRHTTLVPWSKFDAPAIEKEVSLIVDLGNERNDMQLPFVAMRPLTTEVIIEVPVKTEAPVLNCFLVPKKVV